MGLFSNKKKYVVNVTVQPIFEEAQIPQSIKSGVLRGLLTENGDITEYMMEELAGSIGIKVNNGYGWAKRNNIAQGFPTTHMVSNVSARDTVLGVIAVNEGQAITQVYYRMGPMNSFHYAWTWLVNTHAYNATTNELVGLSAVEGFPCYLSDMRATYTRESYDFMVATFDDGVTEQLGPSPRSGWTPRNPFTAIDGIGPYAGQPTFEVSDVAVEDYVTITYEFKNANEDIIVRGLTLPIEGISEEGDYHQVRYVRDNGTTGFFTYLNGSGVYSSIDDVYVLGDNNLGTFYPWAYYRINNQRVSEAYPNIYNSSKGWIKYLGVDYDMMDDAVHEDPEADDVEQCILQLGVKPGSQHPAVLEYLFKHFSLLHESSLSQSQMADTLLDKFMAFTSSPSQIQQIADLQFKQTLQYSGITKKRIPGKIGKVGTYTGSYGSVSQTTQTFTQITPQGVAPVTTTISQPAFVYRYQALDSMFEELAVFNLRIDYKVHTKKGFGAGAGDPELLVPLDRSILATVSPSKREQVVCRALHMLVNTVQVIKTKWYQSSIFKYVMIVVAVVITVLSAGTAWQTIVAAAALGAAALVMTLITMIVQFVAVRFAVKLFVKEVGPQVGFIAAIAAMAYGAYSSFGAGGTTGTWGESLVSIGNNLASESSNAFQSALNEVAEDIQEFQEYAQGQYDSLKEKRDNLGLNPKFMGLDAMDLVAMQPDIVFGEPPQDYYSRTVHSGNIGATSYDLVSYYHDFALQLPKLHDTEGLISNGGEQLPES